MHVGKIDPFSNPVVCILRLVSFVQLGDKTGEDINCKSSIPESEEIWMLTVTDNFLSPALWSVTELAIAIFSCSIPSLTYLFRQAAGSISSVRASRSTRPSANESPPHGSSDFKGNGIRQINSFHRLHDNTSHVDNIELQHYR